LSFVKGPTFIGYSVIKEIILFTKQNKEPEQFFKLTTKLYLETQT